MSSLKWLFGVLVCGSLFPSFGHSESNNCATLEEILSVCPVTSELATDLSYAAFQGATFEQMISLLESEKRLTGQITAENVSRNLAPYGERQICALLSKRQRKAIRKEIRGLSRQNWELLQKYGLVSDASAVRAAISQAKADSAASCR